MAQEDVEGENFDLLGDFIVLNFVSFFSILFERLRKVNKKIRNLIFAHQFQLTLQPLLIRSNCVSTIDSPFPRRMRLSSFDHRVHRLTNSVVDSMQNRWMCVMVTRFDLNCLNVGKLRDQTFDVDGAALVLKCFHSNR